MSSNRSSSLVALFRIKTNSYIYFLDSHVFSNLRCPQLSHNDSSHRQLVIILTTSHVKNRALRDAQREAFSKATLASLGMWRVFLLFESEAVPPETVQTEAAVHEDILQGTFPEAYRNLAYKHLMGLDWAFKHCHHFRWVARGSLQMK